MKIHPANCQKCCGKKLYTISYIQNAIKSGSAPFIFGFQLISPLPIMFISLHLPLALLPPTPCPPLPRNLCKWVQRMKTELPYYDSCNSGEAPSSSFPLPSSPTYPPILLLSPLQLLPLHISSWYPAVPSLGQKQEMLQHKREMMNLKAF